MKRIILLLCVLTLVGILMSCARASDKTDTVSIESLSTCSWIDEGRNLLISGKSSSGKTYLANALAVAALRRFKKSVILRRAG